MSAARWINETTDSAPDVEADCSDVDRGDHRRTKHVQSALFLVLPYDACGTPVEFVQCICNSKDAARHQNEATVLRNTVGQPSKDCSERCKCDAVLQPVKEQPLRRKVNLRLKWPRCTCRCDGSRFRRKKCKTTAGLRCRRSEMFRYSRVAGLFFFLGTTEWSLCSWTSFIPSTKKRRCCHQ